MRSARMNDMFWTKVSPDWNQEIEPYGFRDRERYIKAQESC
jgi:hypothetical protein